VVPKYFSKKNSFLCCMENTLGKRKIFSLYGLNPSASPNREAKLACIKSPLCPLLPCGPKCLYGPPIGHSLSKRALLVRGFFPKSPLPRVRCCFIGDPLLPLTRSVASMPTGATAELPHLHTLPCLPHASELSRLAASTPLPSPLSHHNARG
jgi:hypothetical protein